MKSINILPQGEEFSVGYTKLEEFKDETIRSNNGILIFCTRGEAVLVINGHHHRLIERTVYVIFPYSLIQIQNVSPDFQVKAIITSDTLFLESCIHLEGVIHDFLPNHPTHRIERADVLKSARMFLVWMQRIYMDKDIIVRRELFVTNLRIFFLCVYDAGRKQLMQNGSRVTIDTNTRAGELLKKYMGLVLDHASKVREVSFYANVLCITPKYLNSICKQVIGKTAKEVIDERIIMQLKIALRETDKNIQQISDEFNFPNQSYFGRYFRKAVGISPTEYKKRESY